MMGNASSYKAKVELLAGYRVFDQPASACRIENGEASARENP
jgi:hypothetical protein